MKTKSPVTLFDNHVIVFYTPFPSKQIPNHPGRISPGCLAPKALKFSRTGESENSTRSDDYKGAKK
jgi:hypothetical protein